MPPKFFERMDGTPRHPTIRFLMAPLFQISRDESQGNSLRSFGGLLKLGQMLVLASA